MTNNYVCYTTFSNGNDEEDYSVITILDKNKKEQRIYETYDDIVSDEVLKVLESLSETNFITLSIKNKG